MHLTAYDLASDKPAYLAQFFAHALPAKHKADPEWHAQAKKLRGKRTIKDIAAICGVSVRRVSRLFNCDTRYRKISRFPEKMLQNVQRLTSEGVARSAIAGKLGITPGEVDRIRRILKNREAE